MKYANGEEIDVGDEVIADKSDGIVVCVIDTKQFTKDYPEGWEYLNQGCLVETKTMGLVHYPEVDEDLVLKKRNSK